MMAWGFALFVLGLLGEYGARSKRHPKDFTIHDFFVFMYAIGFVLMLASVSLYLFKDMP